MASDDIESSEPESHHESMPLLEAAPWQAVAFVCGRCENRKGAPKLDTKTVGKRLREGFREARLRSRIVTTGCMGLCPRGALAVAISRGGGPLVVAEFKKKRDVLAVVERLTVDPKSEASPRPLEP